MYIMSQLPFNCFWWCSLGLRNSDIPFTAVYIGLQDGRTEEGEIHFSLCGGILGRTRLFSLQDIASLYCFQFDVFDCSPGLPLNWTNPKPGTVSKLEFKKLFPKFDYVPRLEVCSNRKPARMWFANSWHAWGWSHSCSFPIQWGARPGTRPVRVDASGQGWSWLLKVADYFQCKLTKGSQIDRVRSIPSLCCLKVRV